MRPWTRAFAAAVAAAAWSSPGTVAQEPAPAEPVVHTYREVGGVPLQAHVFRPALRAGSGPSPAMVLLHGGGWAVGSPEWTFTAAREYAQLGIVAIPIQYRLSNDRVTPIDALEDVCAAFQWVRARAGSLGVDPRRIGASGVSAGGHLAAAAATIGCGSTEGAYGTGGPDALVLWSPALDVSGDGYFRRLLLGRAPVDAYSPVEHVRATMPPVHIVHGERDTLTPLSGARRFCDRVVAGGGRCELQVYPGVGHLLTRNLANQESDFDPDPAARADGNARQRAFVQALWLSKPPPSRVDAIAAARTVMADARYATFITLDDTGHPQSRIMDPFPPEEDLTIWIATNARSRKVGQIEADPRVTLTYFVADHQSYVTVLGVARAVRDAREKARLWKEEWATFYTDRNRGDDYLLIRVTPRRLEVLSERLGMTNDPVTWRPVVVDLAAPSGAK